jgi:hypothetical protein
VLGQSSLRIHGSYLISLADPLARLFFLNAFISTAKKILNIRDSENGDQEQAGSQIAEHQAQANRKRRQAQITP